MNARRSLAFYDGNQILRSTFGWAVALFLELHSDPEPRLGRHVMPQLMSAVPFYEGAMYTRTLDG